MADKLETAAKVVGVVSAGVGIVALVWAMFRKQPSQVNPPPGPGPVYYYFLPGSQYSPIGNPTMSYMPYIAAQAQAPPQAPPCPCGRHTARASWPE